MNFETIELSVDRGVAWLTLNRPRALNALSPTMLAELQTALASAAEDSTARVVVVTGRGRAFCAGADLGEVEAQSAGPSIPELVQQLVGQVRALPLPAVAAVNGHTMAGGLELAMACDVVVAARSARLGDAHANVGVIPGAGGATVLPRLVGPVFAKYLLFTGDAVSAKEMQRAGLVAQVFEDATFVDDVHALAERIATKSPLALRIVKQLVQQGLERSSVADALRLEIDANEAYADSADMAEGIRAFTESRTPQFTGR